MFNHSWIKSQMSKLGFEYTIMLYVVAWIWHVENALEGNIYLLHADSKTSLKSFFISASSEFWCSSIAYKQNQQIMWSIKLESMEYGSTK